MTFWIILFLISKEILFYVFVVFQYAEYISRTEESQPQVGHKRSQKKKTLLPALPQSSVKCLPADPRPLHPVHHT